jgi:predicted secreted protein
MADIIQGPFNGRQLGIYVGNVLQAYSKSCALSFKVGTMDTTTKDSILWADFLPTVKDWSITCDGLVALNSAANAAKLADYLIAGTLVVVKFSVHDSGNLYWYGSAYVTSVDMTAGMDEPVSYTATFTGDGVLTKARMT